MKRTVFPFVAVLGQEPIKNALLWNLVNPLAGGALVCGEKGTAKSTLARGAAELRGDTRLIDLPLNITEDRLVGSIDMERALKDGKRVLDPGLLFQADGNILYVDEVNLLSDHIANALLQAAASGVNTVEREGISLSHPSRFILVGSMNEEEGKLRPQLLDRFGLFVRASGERDPLARAEIMRRRLAFEADPLGFIEAYANETAALAKKIGAAKKILEKVETTANAMRLAASMAAEARCAGHRGEIALVETARAIAALDKRSMANIADLKLAAEYALPHRMQERQAPRDMRDQKSTRDETQDDSQDETLDEEQQAAPERQDTQQTEGDSQKQEQDAAPPEAESKDEGEAPQDEDDVEQAGDAFIIPRWQDGAMPRAVKRGSGRRNRVLSENKQGRYVRYRLPREEKISDLAFDATVRAAAPYQNFREKNNRAIAIEKDDLRVKVREKRAGGCILFVVDASASMGANRRMKEVKAAILSMLNLSYQKRDRVGLIAFRRDSAELLLGITRSVELAQKKLAELPTGGKTPLAAGLNLAYEVLMGLKMKESDVAPTLVLISDGRASGSKKNGANPFNEALEAAARIGNQNINAIILDTENDFIRFHLCEELNEKLRGTLISMETLKAEGIVRAVSAFGN
jgi:magnesium chelatase subunit D